MTAPLTPLHQAIHEGANFVHWYIPDISKTLISCFWMMRKWSYRWSCDPSLDNWAFSPGSVNPEGWCGGNMSRSVLIPAVGPWQSLPDTWAVLDPSFSQPDSASILSILWITLSPSNKFSPLFKLASVIFHYMKLNNSNWWAISFPNSCFLLFWVLQPLSKSDTRFRRVPARLVLSLTFYDSPKIPLLY